MINHDAALGYLDYYGEDALGITIVSPRVRAPRQPCYERSPTAVVPRRSAPCPAPHGG